MSGGAFLDVLLSVPVWVCLCTVPRSRSGECRRRSHRSGWLTVPAGPSLLAPLPLAAVVGVAYRIMALHAGGSVRPQGSADRSSDRRSLSDPVLLPPHMSMIGGQGASPRLAGSTAPLLSPVAGSYGLPNLPLSSDEG